MTLYQYAVKTEMSGFAFYRNMADHACKEGIRRVFSMMASDEKELLKKLDVFRKRYPEINEMECISLENQPIPFVHICDNGQCRHIATDLDAYQLAMKAERQVAQGYLKAAEEEQDPHLRQMLAWMAALANHELHQIEQLFDFAEAPNRSLEWGEFSNLDEFHNFGYYEDLRQGEMES